MVTAVVTIVTIACACACCGGGRHETIHCQRRLAAIVTAYVQGVVVVNVRKG